MSTTLCSACGVLVECLQCATRSTCPSWRFAHMTRGLPLSVVVSPSATGPVHPFSLLSSAHHFSENEENRKRYFPVDARFSRQYALPSPLSRPSCHSICFMERHTSKKRQVVPSTQWTGRQVYKYTHTRERRGDKMSECDENVFLTRNSLGEAGCDR